MPFSLILSSPVLYFLELLRHSTPLSSVTHSVQSNAMLASQLVQISHIYHSRLIITRPSENKVGRSTPRVTYFTPIDNILNVIEEKFSKYNVTLRSTTIGGIYATSTGSNVPACRHSDTIWIETLYALPEVETPGLDITREERNHYNRMTPMADLTRSVETTPQEDVILTPWRGAL